MEAVEVSNNKIEEDPNQENVQTVKIIQKAEIAQHQSSCYRCCRLHQGTCPAIDKKCHNCLKMGHYATNCKSPKAMASAMSTLSASMGQLTIASSHNPEKLDLVEVEVENIDGRREKAKFLPDTGANITAFQPEILPQLGMSVDNPRMVATVPKSANGSNLKNLEQLTSNSANRATLPSSLLLM